VVVTGAGHLHIQVPGFGGVSLVGTTFASAAAFAAASAAFTSPKALFIVIMMLGTSTLLNFNSDSVTESVRGFECHMNARPLPDGDWPSCASSGVSCVQSMLGVISFGITGLHVK
jgi:hypothetical protein